MLRAFVLILFLMGSSALASGAELTLRWDPSEGAAGYRIYMSVDQGQTWQMALDAGGRTQATMQDVPEEGIVLFKVSAYNAAGRETVTDWAGAWYNGKWRPPEPPRALGIN